MGLKVRGSGVNFGFGVEGFGLRLEVSGLGLTIWGLGFGVETTSF